MTAARSPQWGGGASSRVKTAPPAPVSFAPRQQSTLTASLAMGRPGIGMAKKTTKNAWRVPMVRPPRPPWSRRLPDRPMPLAASRGPRGESATKFMAKQTKEGRKRQPNSQVMVVAKRAIRRRRRTSYVPWRLESRWNFFCRSTYYRHPTNSSCSF